MLCEKCKVISFNDQLPGLKEITLDNGQIVLDCEGHVLELEFDRWDSFPDFPDLKSSAETGCGFCSLLRAVLQEQLAGAFEALPKARPVDRRIQLTQLRYEWDREHYQDPPDEWIDQSKRWEGISFLEIMARNADRSVFRRFGFDVVADEGKLESFSRDLFC
jgi:hypothetical protein